MLQAVTSRGLLNIGCILPDARADTPRKAFAQMARALQRAHGLQADALVERLCLREGRGGTALGNGIALPHADTWGLTRPHAAFLRSSRPVAFKGWGGPVQATEMLVLVAPRPATAAHNAMLQHYRALLLDADFRAALAAARTVEDIWFLFREREWNKGGYSLTDPVIPAT